MKTLTDALITQFYGCVMVRTQREGLRMWSKDTDTLCHGESGTVVIFFYTKLIFLIFWEPVQSFLSHRTGQKGVNESDHGLNRF